MGMARSLASDRRTPDAGQPGHLVQQARGQPTQDVRDPDNGVRSRPANTRLRAGPELAGSRAVPSRRHQVLVELFRNCGELAPELLRTCAGIKLDHDHVEPGSIDLSQVASTEYRADSVV